MLFAKLALVIPAVPDRLLLVNPLIVFDPAAIVLLVNVSVVALPNKVSVAAGNVNEVVPAVALANTVVVPEVEPLNLAPVEPIVGKVKVLLVTICVPVKVTSSALISLIAPTKFVAVDVNVEGLPISSVDKLLNVVLNVSSVSVVSTVLNTKSPI